MWRLYRLFVGIITCHPIAKIGGYLVTFATISGLIYTVGTTLYHVESPYIGIIFVAVVPPSFFGGLLLVPLTNDGSSFSGQLIGAATIFFWVFIVSLIVWGILKAVMGIRVDEEEEYTGLDIGECGLEAYPEFTTASD